MIAGCYARAYRCAPAYIIINECHMCMKQHEVECLISVRETRALERISSAFNVGMTLRETATAAAAASAEPPTPLPFPR